MVAVDQGRGPLMPKEELHRFSCFFLGGLSLQLLEFCCEYVLFCVLSG